ncbi:two-component system response regulator [Thalassotalea euphylliae]|uniref:GGDEF domain-containing response regulator n=1 Tax=Thalassotalea euphylliae TaxID=1655234 RepID=A0A3E0UJS1_9GAMM|nr:GGDEF domain-containing response regulator [Thalassotalea euphylliae]REL37159.1 GGDEF domain-containing response regulator [Thalassotalea euphylliae]
MYNQLNVLIVDDDDIERASLKRALSNADFNYNIVEESEPNKALQQLTYQNFDVVLLDYLMPAVNGIELMLKLKKSPFVCETAFIMVSNYADDELILDAINAGAQDFVLKEDITPSQLKRSILQAKKRYELEQELYDSYQKVKSMAERDSLTGLYNRYHFEESLLQRIKAGLRHPSEIIVVMLLDLDKFKHINDTYGHNVGDQLLVEVAKRFKKVFRSNELFARLGGDEFAFACGQLKSLVEAKQIGNRLLEALAEPFMIDDHLVHSSASVGMALFPLNGDTQTELMKCADIAMYRAKQNVHEKLCVYEDNMQAEILFKYKIETELRRASFAQDFELHYQPIVKQGQIMGAEALVRWPKANVTQRPDQFIPVAEECGLIQKLGLWVFDKALEELATYLQSPASEFYVSINVSPCQLTEAGFAKAIINRLKQKKILAKNITIEITETALLNDNTATLENLEALYEYGIKIALDDFGTGYSSLSHLLKCPIHTVKIDRSIIDDSGSQHSMSKAMLAGVASMLQKLNMRVVAEGIESAEQADYCQQLHIHYHQGYFYYKPMPLASLTKLVSRSDQISSAYS